MSELTPASIKKLKVAELRSELAKLGLDTKGTKPILVERLLGATSDKKEENNDVEAVAKEENETASKEESSQESQDESATSTKADNSMKSVEPSEEVNESSKVEDDNVVEEKPVSEAVPLEKSEADKATPAEVSNETAEVSNEISEVSNETVEVQPTRKVDDVVSEPSKPSINDTSKAGDKEEPMDQTPATEPSTEPSSSKTKDTPKEQNADDLDASVNISKVEEEPEVEMDDSLVVVDKYNCDLYIKFDPEALRISTLKEECFTYLSGGARATWGVTSGKVCFEVKVTGILDIYLPETEVPKQFVRVGWSVDEANLQLGEDRLSYGYDSTGKKCVLYEFTDFGQKFGKDDVITCYLDLESEVKTISYSKNGEDVGEAFTLGEEIQGKALFPHVLMRNAETTINFGSKEEPWFAAKEGFVFIQNSPEDSKVHGKRPPASKEDCEVLMMVGLPASGKTTYVKNHVSANPDKRYNILGTNTILDRMKLLGVPRKQEVGGYNKYMDKAAKCLHRLFEIAPSKRRNYILDQTNVYMSAQNKKMRPFEGFRRKALVCVPTHEVLTQRIEDRKKEGIELPFNTVCDMKRSFTIPKVGDLFDEVTYIDQDEETSKKIIHDYVKDGNYQRRRTYSGSGEPEHKRPRHNDRPRYGGHGGGGGGGGGGWSSGSPRDYRHHDDRRGSYRSPNQNRRGGSPQYGRGGRGGGYRGGRGGGGFQGGGFQDRRSYGGGYGGNKGYGGGKSYGGGGGGGGGRGGGGGGRGGRGGGGGGGGRGGYGRGGGSSFGGRGGGYSNQQSHKQQHNYSTQQQSPQQPAQQQYTQQAQGSYGSNYNQFYQNYQQYGQQPQQNTTPSATQPYQQQYQAYYQQQGNTYQQGGYSGYGY